MHGCPAGPAECGQQAPGSWGPGDYRLPGTHAHHFISSSQQAGEGDDSIPTFQVRTLRLKKVKSFVHIAGGGRDEVGLRTGRPGLKLCVHSVTQFPSVLGGEDLWMVSHLSPHTSYTMGPCVGRGTIGR